MRTLIQKIHVEEHHSFACRTYKTPNFETNWHKHEECELIVFNEGFGSAMIGDFVGEFKVGDVFFVGSNVPHAFRKYEQKMIASATAIQFKKSILGNDFLHLPEMKSIAQFLAKTDGIELTNELREIVAQQILAIEKLEGFERLFSFIACLETMSTSGQLNAITTNFHTSSSHINPAIEKIIDFSFKHYLDPITLEQVAAVADMSIPTFCRFFKKNIKKTYFDFLQELRISHACKLLTHTNKPVTEICYESGFNSWAHFSKQFKKIKHVTPSVYRKQFSEE